MLIDSPVSTLLSDDEAKMIAGWLNIYRRAKETKIRWLARSIDAIARLSATDSDELPTLQYLVGMLVEEFDQTTVDGEEAIVGVIETGRRPTFHLIRESEGDDFHNFVKLLESDGWLADHVKFLAGQFAKGVDVTPVKVGKWLNDELQQFESRVWTTKHMLEQHPAEFCKVITDYAKKDVAAGS